MNYRPVPLTTRICVHCGRSFEAKRKDRRYCSSHCVTSAWLARRSQVIQPVSNHKRKRNQRQLLD